VVNVIAGFVFVLSIVLGGWLFYKLTSRPIERGNEMMIIVGPILFILCFNGVGYIVGAMLISLFS
jgi:hypothetical protein